MQYTDTVPLWFLMGCSIFSKYYSKCVCVHVFACVSGPRGSAAAISGDGVRGQCACAVETRRRCEGLPSGLGSIYRSAQSQHLTTACVSVSIFIYFFYQFAYTYLYIFIVHKGRNVETVELAGDSEFHTLPNLQPDTEYIVTIIPLYEGNTEGPVATASFKIGRLFFFCSSSRQFSTFLCKGFSVFIMPSSLSKLHTHQSS